MSSQFYIDMEQIVGMLMTIFVEKKKNDNFGGKFASFVLVWPTQDQMV